MKFEQKNIDEASPDERRAFATRILGVQATALTSDAEIESKIRAAAPDGMIWIFPEEEIDQAGTPPPAPFVTDDNRSSLVGGLGRLDPKVNLTLHAEERDGVVQNRHKEVGVNGVVWAIKRGIPVDVPYRVYLALSYAVRDMITHDDEGTIISQQVHSVPFSVHRMPSPAEIEAFHDRTRDKFCPA